MGRHAGKRSGSARPPDGRRPGLGLLGWAVFAAALAAAALLWVGVPLATAGAVPVLVLVAFALVWVAAWRTGRASGRDAPTTDAPSTDAPTPDVPPLESAGPVDPPAGASVGDEPDAGSGDDHGPGGDADEPRAADAGGRP